jgi:CheY-like chemotaxis protein
MSGRYALVIDDNKLVADSVGKMLQLLGFQVKVAYGPRTAISSFTSQFPNLIMLDINMPGVDGVEVCRFLRRDPRTAHVPVIAMSTENQPEMIQRISLAGANKFLAKPIAFEALEQAVQEIEKGATVTSK